jgi:DNA-binding CsgD family transcriptional regulator/PAS domain-containing protein
MYSANEAARLIASTYDAALEPGRWPDLLQLIADRIGSPVARLSLENSGPRVEMLAWLGAEASFTRAYEDHFVELDPVMQVVRATVPGTVVTEGAVSGSTLERSEFYQQWVRPQGLYKATMTKFLHEGDALGVLVCASPQKPDRKTGSDGPRLLHQLAPHLQRAIRVHLRIGQLSIEQRAAIEVLDLLTHALFVVDASARIKFANRAAEALLARADGVQCSPRGLCALTTARTNRLHALVAQAAGVGHDVEVGGAMTIERPSLKRAYQVLVAPLTARTSWATVVSHGPAAVVIVIDPHSAVVSAEEQIRAFYGLTRAEARIACAVGKGDGISAVAEALGVLPSTARTHLHHVFLKTGTQGQAELVRLVDQVAFIRYANDTDHIVTQEMMRKEGG